MISKLFIYIFLGKYLCDGDSDPKTRYAAPPSSAD